MAGNTKNVKNSIKLDVFIMNQSLQFLYLPTTSFEVYVTFADEKMSQWLLNFGSNKRNFYQ